MNNAAWFRTLREAILAGTVVAAWVSGMPMDGSGLFLSGRTSSSLHITDTRIYTDHCEIAYVNDLGPVPICDGHETDDEIDLLLNRVGLEHGGSESKGD